MIRSLKDTIKFQTTPGFALQLICVIDSGRDEIQSWNNFQAHWYFKLGAVESVFALMYFLPQDTQCHSSLTEHGNNYTVVSWSWLLSFPLLPDVSPVLYFCFFREGVKEGALSRIDKFSLWIQSEKEQTEFFEPSNLSWVSKIRWCWYG